ncbi:MAG: biotin/lipoyl-binding protein [Anaerolineae bacterium]
MRRIIIGIIALAILATAGFFGYRQFLAPVEATPTPELDLSAQSRLPEVVSAEGFVVPAHKAELSFEIGGEVVEVAVEEGDTVEEGQVLVRLDSSRQQRAVEQAMAGVEQAEAAVSSAQATLNRTIAGPTQEEIARAEATVQTARAQLAQVKAGPRPEEIAQAEAAVRRAEASLNQLLAGARPEDLEAAAADMLSAQAVLRQAQAAYDEIAWAGNVGETPQAVALEQATLAYQAARAQYERLLNGATAEEIAIAQAGVDEAKAALAAVQAGATDEEIAVAEAGVAEAEAALAALLAGATDEEIAIAKAGVSEAEAGLASAQAALSIAQAALEDYELKAPYAAQVARISVEEGEYVAPGVPVVSLSDSSTWYVETDDLTEIDVVRVAVGQPVRVTIDAISDREFEGVVTDVAPRSEIKRGDVTYTVTIELLDVEDAPLRWGLTAFVDINVE